jgi:DNA invertase Pin-like site-specific DNA recombinase
LAWSVDRLGRSLQDPITFLSELHAVRVDLYLHQQGLDTTTPSGKAMFQMMGVFAEFERAMIQERVRAGLKRARDEGKKLGRPRIPEKIERAVQAALAKKNRPGVGKSLFALSAALAVAGGGEFLGWTTAKKEGGWRVLYIDGEMHIADIQERANLLLDAVPGLLHIGNCRLGRISTAVRARPFWGLT